jgi:hypothetical protein
MAGQLKAEPTDLGRWILATAGSREHALIELAKVHLVTLADQLKRTQDGERLGSNEIENAQKVSKVMYISFCEELFYAAGTRDGSVFRRLAFVIERFLDTPPVDPVRVKLIQLRLYCERVRPTIEELAQKVGYTGNREVFRRMVADLKVAVAGRGKPRKTLRP